MNRPHRSFQTPPPGGPRTLPSVLAWLIMILAFVLRARGMSWGLPAILEEATPMREAVEIWRDLAAGRVDLNPHFFHYPSFSIYLQAVLQGAAYVVEKLTGPGYDLRAFLVFHQVDPTLFVHLGRASSAVFAAGTIGLLYLIVKRLAGPVAGLAAAGVLAVLPFHLAESRFVQTDVPLAFFTTLTVLLALRLVERRRATDYFALGAALGLATATKYPGLFALVCLIPAHAAVCRREGRSLRRGLFDRRLLETALAAALVFFIASPYVILDFSSFWKDLTFERTHMQVGHFVTGGGEGPALSYYVGDVLVPGLGVLLSIAFFGGLLLLLAPLPRFRGEPGTGSNRFVHLAWREDPRLVVFALLPLCYLLLVGSWSMRAPRYLLPLAPLAAGVSVIFLFRLPRLLPIAPAAGRRLTLVLTAAALIQPALAGLSVARVTRDTRGLARRWIVSNVPAGRTIVSEVLGPRLWQESEVERARSEMETLEEPWRREGLAWCREVPTYRLVEMPFYALYPEGSAPYYDVRLVRAARWMVTSDGVARRYLAQPDRYPDQVRFYENLETYWERAAVFERGGAVGGPRIVVYHLAEDAGERLERGLGPAPPEWFRVPGVRISPESLNRFAAPLAETALEDGNDALAAVLYLAAETASPDDPGNRFGMATCLVREGRFDEALERLEWLVDRLFEAPVEEEGTGGAQEGIASLRTRARAVTRLLGTILESPSAGEKTLARARALRRRLSPVGAIESY
jgi:4-amino-4-deoxy-L-arabinose transferase-like glycosyltransferase